MSKQEKARNNSHWKEVILIATDKKKSNKKRIVILIVLAILLVGGGVFLGIWLAGGNQVPDDLNIEGPLVARGTVAMPDNIDELMAQRGNPVEAGYYTTKMTNDWVFDTVSSPPRNVYVENPTRNNNTVYFDLLLDSGELLYSSPYIPVGAFIESITLDVPLAPGEYSPVVVYHLVDDDFNVLSTVSVRITLRILG